MRTAFKRRWGALGAGLIGSFPDTLGLQLASQPVRLYVAPNPEPPDCLEPRALEAAASCRAARLKNLIHLELKEQRRQFKERIRSTSDETLVKQGLALLDLLAVRVNFAELGSRNRISYLEAPTPLAPNHDFEPGDLVLIRTTDTKKDEGHQWEGTVVSINSQGLHVELYRKQCTEDSDDSDGDDEEASFAILGTGQRVRVDKAFSQVAYDRQKQALALLPLAISKDSNKTSKQDKTVARNANDKAHDSMGCPFFTQHQEAVTQGSHTGLSWLRPGARGTSCWWSVQEVASGYTKGTHLRDMLASEDNAFIRQLAFKPSSLTFNADEVAAHVRGCNATQHAAITTALSHSLALIHGPPGTGKTHTTAALVSFVKQGLTKKFKSPVLVCGQSNTAVDKLVEALVATGLKVVRLGNPTRVNPQALHVTLLEQTKRHPRYKELEKLIARAVSLRTRLAEERGLLGNSCGDEQTIKARMTELMKAKKAVQGSIDRLKDRIQRGIISGSEVVCCTCIGAGGPELKGFSFPLLVLDEGSQASEPEALVPIMKGTRQVIIVGDHKQLPPTVLSPKAAEQGLGVSLFERMMEAGVPSTLLGVQYRAHPLLSEFPSARFYAGAVQSGVKPDDRPQLTPPFPPGKGAAGHPPLVFFHDGSSKEEPGDSGKSYTNEGQATLVARIVTSLVKSHDVQPSSIGCISFYAAQVSLIKSLLHQPNEGMMAVQVASVDGFQGQEKDVIVISTVRSNSGGNIGFLKDPRRLNVAITRAKRLLVVVGNKATLTAGGCPHWKAWMEYLEDKGWVLPVPKLEQ